MDSEIRPMMGEKAIHIVRSRPVISRMRTKPLERFVVCEFRPVLCEIVNHEAIRVELRAVSRTESFPSPPPRTLPVHTRNGPFDSAIAACPRRATFLHAPEESPMLCGIAHFFAISVWA